MKKIGSGHFYGRLQNKKEHYPWHGQIELTYRCNLNCVHCYCKGLEDKSYTPHAPRSTSYTRDHTIEAEPQIPITDNRELTTNEWKEILDEICKEGCLWLCFTGGEPLIRDDFLEIYSYAKNKGFIITLFTNGQGFREEVIDFLVKSPPYSIEITLNGITKDTYEIITQIDGSYLKVMKNIRIAAERKLPLILKTNCLKQNKHEIVKIKKFSEGLLDRSNGKYYFRYDPMVYPRLNGKKAPCDYRLSFEEILELTEQDADIRKEYQKGLHQDLPDLERDKGFLYRCNAWMSQFFINPYGKLKFCQFSERFSADLKTTSFKEGFYGMFSKLLKEKFKTTSKCKDCPLRPICYYCPARAYLETGDEEAPVEYYCQLAEKMAKQMRLDR